MFVTHVIPLRRGIGLDTLTYFGSTKYELGTLLTIPIRNSNVLGLVTEVNEVSTAKTAIRAATFTLRKIPDQIHTKKLGSAYIETARELSTLYGTHMGNILFNLLPPEIQHGDIPLPHTHHVPAEEVHAPQILTAHRAERFQTYRSLVRETFAHSGSVLIVVPTSTEAEGVREALARGIEDRVSVLTSTLGKRQLKASYEALQDFSRSKLIIATPSHAVLERHDITLTILEHARSPHYKERVRPYLDYRDVLRIHAKHTGRMYIIGDILPRAEDEHARREERFQTYGESPKRIALPGKLEIIPLKEKPEDTTFSLFSPKIVPFLKEIKKKKQHVFLFAARRGLAPIVTCADCGIIFRSPESGAPYSLIRTVKNGVEERWFVCSTSGERIRAKDTCDVCGSWRLRERGIGIQFVHDELKKLLPGTPIVLFDHITASTYKKATFLRDTFYNTKGSIMLGTHMAIPYLTKPIDHTLIVNMDALLATPTWRLEEDNLALLLELREVTKGSVYVQSRTKDIDLFTYAKHAEIESFYTDELALRKTYNYPPFSVFVHLTWQGTDDVVKKIETTVTELLTPFGVSVYQSPHAPKGSMIMYALIRVPKAEWPKAPLIALLKTLPPSVRIMLDPDRIV